MQAELAVRGPVRGQYGIQVTTREGCCAGIRKWQAGGRGAEERGEARRGEVR